MRAWQWWLAGWVMIMVPLAGMADHIQLQPEAHVEFTNGQPVVALCLMNSGDAAAKVLAIETSLDGRTLLRKTPGETIMGEGIYSGRFPVPPPPDRPGLYQAISRIRYADFGGVEFSSVTVSDFPWGLTNAQGTCDSSWMAASILPATMGRGGPVEVSLLLLQSASVEVTVRLVLPDEFECAEPGRRVPLDPDTARVEKFEIINRRGLPGGSYTFCAIVEYELAGIHRSASTTGTITVAETAWLGQSYTVWLAGTGLCLAVLLALIRRQRRGYTVSAPDGSTGRAGRLLDVSLLALVSLFILWNLDPGDLVRNTTTVGGDTPAHLYLVSHLKEQLFHHGRLISWAGGWWCGFPMFQYYFVLPYLSAALLSVVIPLTVAFKFISVAGMLMTPLCAYWAGRIWRLPRPAPLVLAIAMVPFLFVHSHVMWGVNTASTLAGMIANSWSFALMLPALASASRDAGDGRFRLGTVFLMVLVLASHFFTSVMMILSLGIVPLLADKGHRWWEGLKVLCLEGLLAGLLMAWWLVPLIAKSGYSMDFGVNWDVTLWKSLPAYSAGLLVFAGVAVVAGWKVVRRPVWILAWMLGVGTLLFKAGFAMSPVFVNVRLWPFIFFSLVALGAIGMGLLLSRLRKPGWIIVILTAGILLAVMAGDSLTGRLGGPGLTRSWATWNYSGLESKPAATVIAKLVMPLKGTPGRLANDLCEENNQIGSSRIFEQVPFLAGKPVLEGGLVNSALGSMYAYAVQAEASGNCAGAPPIVAEQPFNFTNATRHLELFAVKHFIARTELTKKALRQNPEWRLVEQEQDWDLYELLSHEGRLVFIPPRLPVVVETARWKECSLQWLYTLPALDQFAVWSGVSRGTDLAGKGLPHLTEARFLDVLSRLKRGETNGFGTAVLPEAGTGSIRDEVVTDDSIRFRTSAIGLPHIVKVSWFPNWKVRGARNVYCVSPGFMLVFPEQETVELYYGTTASDGVGYVLTGLGCLGVVLAARKNLKI